MKINFNVKKCYEILYKVIIYFHCPLKNSLTPIFIIKIFVSAYIQKPDPEDLVNRDPLPTPEYFGKHILINVCLVLALTSQGFRNPFNKFVPFINFFFILLKCMENCGFSSALLVIRAYLLAKNASFLVFSLFYFLLL